MEKKILFSLLTLGPIPGSEYVTIDIRYLKDWTVKKWQNKGEWLHKFTSMDLIWPMCFINSSLWLSYEIV